MARFEMNLPTDVMADIKKLNDNYDHIFGGMTKAGANVVMKNIKAFAPKGIQKSKMMNCLKMTTTYKTPSDDGINTKVGFYGYFINENGQREPAPLVANVFEYGRSDKPFKKHPFLRKAFKNGEIEKAMLEAQKQLSGGLLDE